MEFEDLPGATPLDRNEMEALIPSDINTQAQLNEAEQSNIIQARSWATQKKHKELLTEAFLKRIHFKMFNLVWRWAGQYRKSDKNLGSPWYDLTTDIHKLLADSQYWIEHHTYDWDELAVHFHHRLVCIHPFPNGNGRHARLLTDLLMIEYNQEPFSWGENSVDPNQVRAQYLKALRLADQRNYRELLVFVRA